MNLEEEFDDIFKRKTEEAKFSFKESDWEKARKMIDKERLAAFNASSRFNYWYVSAAVLVSSIALIYVSLPEATQVAQADEVVYLPENTVSDDKHNISSETVSETNVMQTGEENSPETETSSSVLTKPEPNIQGKPNSVAPKRSEAKSLLAAALPYISSNDQNGINEQNDLITSEQIGTQEKVETLETVEGISILPKKEYTLAFFQSESNLQLNPVFLKRYEEDYARKAKPKFVRSYLDLGFGMIYSGGWENKGIVTAKGLNGYVGLNYGHFLSKKMSFSIGAELYNLSHMDQEFYSSTSKNYGFGSVQTQTTLACQSMLFVSFPLKVYYSIDQNHLIGLGLHAGNLLMSSNTIETNELMDGMKQNVNSVSSKGVYEGMNTRNMMLSASLQKTVADRISLQVELYYGISDLFTNTPSDQNHQNTNSIRLGMNYRIFRN